MARGLLVAGDAPRHSPLHDMESFFWLLVWVCFHRVINERYQSKETKETTDVDTKLIYVITSMLGTDRPPESTGYFKSEFIADLARGGWQRVNRLGRFHPQLKALAQVAWSKFPLTRKGKAVLKPDIVEAAFDEYLKAFDDNIPDETLGWKELALSLDGLV